MDSETNETQENQQPALSAEKESRDSQTSTTQFSQDIIDSKEQRIKYPRTPHLPWSPGAKSDDRVLEDADCFETKRVVATVKMDGENTTLYRDGIHARSRDFVWFPDRDWVMKFQLKLSKDIPPNFRICGENMFAQHSIHYDNLSSYFLGFSIWDGLTCLSWKETLEWFELLGITPVPELMVFDWDEDTAKSLTQPRFLGGDEGVVFRDVESFRYDQFGFSVAKWVRKNHVQTDNHWRNKPMVQNKLLPIYKKRENPYYKEK